LNESNELETSYEKIIIIRRTIMKCTLEITKNEFLNLKDGKEEGYSELDRRYFCRLSTKEDLQNQVDEVRKGGRTQVFFLERVSSGTYGQKSIPSLAMVLRIATLVEEHRKDIVKDLAEVAKLAEQVDSHTAKDAATSSPTGLL